MSDYASIKLTGHSNKELLETIEKIKQWSPNHPIKVCLTDDVYDYTLYSIENVENAIKTDLVGYINGLNKDKSKCLKTGGNDDLYLVDNPDIIFGSGKFKKVKKIVTNLTPKKKKRKK